MDRKKAVELSVLLLSVASQVSTFDKERFYDAPRDIRNLKSEIPDEYIEQFDEAVNTFKEKISNIAVQLIDELS